jgi:hypothetical protein
LSSAIVTVFAHLGHWYVGLPVYMSPVVLLIVGGKWAEWRDRRRTAREDTRKAVAGGDTKAEP